ncbi:uridine diphosphate glucose pyrophosphatase NUDT22 isoform X2 [Procambarus clarkii]|nr:uridine diphosphate glucose pyrophosphatase NUDT22-like isoform X2 [Procambarus clarkii]
MERTRLGQVEVVWQRPATPGAAIKLSQVAAKFEPSKFARRASWDIDQQVNKLWEAKRAKNSRLYNGDKFRLAGWYREEEKWVLEIGVTSYKDLCGTNLAHNARSLQERGSKDFGNAQAYMSDPIGVGVLVVTSDGFLVAVRRAGWTGEYPGALDRPGGHPEPERVLTTHHTHSSLDDAVLKEVWTSAAHEVEDEVGIPKDQLDHLTLLGIVLNVEAGGRPSLEFFTR